MRFAAIALPALVAVANAATTQSCAALCIGKGVTSSGCSLSDSHCICSNEPLLAAAEQCVLDTCTVEQQEYGLATVRALCGKMDLVKRHASAEPQPASSWWSKLMPRAALQIGQLQAHGYQRRSRAQSQFEKKALLEGLPDAGARPVKVHRRTVQPPPPTPTVTVTTTSTTTVTDTSTSTTTDTTTVTDTSTTTDTTTVTDTSTTTDTSTVTDTSTTTKTTTKTLTNTSTTTDTSTVTATSTTTSTTTSTVTAKPKTTTTTVTSTITKKPKTTTSVITSTVTVTTTPYWCHGGPGHGGPPHRG